MNVWRVDTGQMGVIGGQKWPCGGLEGRPACTRWGKQTEITMSKWTCGTGRPTLRQERRILTRLQVDHSVSTTLAKTEAKARVWCRSLITGRVAGVQADWQQESGDWQQTKRGNKQETIKIHKDKIFLLCLMRYYYMLLCRNLRDWCVCDYLKLQSNDRLRLISLSVWLEE